MDESVRKTIISGYRAKIAPIVGGESRLSEQLVGLLKEVLEYESRPVSGDDQIIDSSVERQTAHALEKFGMKTYRDVVKYLIDHGSKPIPTEDDVDILRKLHNMGNTRVGQIRRQLKLRNLLG